MSSALRAEQATIADLHAVLEAGREFWGERELPALHHHLLVHEFGETALVIRREDGLVVAYLFGLLTPRRVGYVHLVAVREGRRREGLARLLYERFEQTARAHGALALKAVTTPGNAASLAFHRALGFHAHEAPDYSGPGQPRMVLCKRLQDA